MNGLLLTDHPFEVFDALEGARYAGKTRHGQGIVALDDVTHGDVFRKGVFYAEEPIPDNPDTWPEWARPSRGPKRKVADGSEAFIILTLFGDGTTQGRHLRSLRIEAFGIFEGPRGRVIIAETTKTRAARYGAVDTLMIEEYQDSRLALAG